MLRIHVTGHTDEYPWGDTHMLWAKVIPKNQTCAWFKNKFEDSGDQFISIVN